MNESQKKSKPRKLDFDLNYFFVSFVTKILFIVINFFKICINNIIIFRFRFRTWIFRTSLLRLRSLLVQFDRYFLDNLLQSIFFVRISSILLLSMAFSILLSHLQLSSLQKHQLCLPFLLMFFCCKHKLICFIAKFSFFFAFLSASAFSSASLIMRSISSSDKPELD